MTTLGKILVFLVFFGALAVGGLMVFVAKTSPNWKAAVKERDDYIAVLKANVDAGDESRKKWLSEYESMKKALDANLIETRAIQIKLKRDADDKALEADAATTASRKSDTLAKQAQAETTRLQQELLFLQGVVKDRDDKILTMQADVVTAKNDAQAAKNNAETANARAVNLLEKIREIEGQLAKALQKGQPGPIVASVLRDANYTNPPSVSVKGVIEEVDKTDKKLVKISVGSDNGVRKGQTLEVFRTSPKAEYLGRLLVVDADFRFAIAQLMPQPGVSGSVTLMPGDEVAGKLR